MLLAFYTIWFGKKKATIRTVQNEHVDFIRSDGVASYQECGYNLPVGWRAWRSQDGVPIESLHLTSSEEYPMIYGSVRDSLNTWTKPLHQTADAFCLRCERERRCNWDPTASPWSWRRDEGGKTSKGLAARHSLVRKNGPNLPIDWRFQTKHMFLLQCSWFQVVDV